MAVKGLGQGVLLETKTQAKTIQNAARYLTGEAKAGSISTTSNDNRKTYNQQISISFAGSNFYVNDKQDAYALTCSRKFSPPPGTRPYTEGRRHSLN